MIVEEFRSSSGVASYEALDRISAEMLEAARRGDRTTLEALRALSLSIADELRKSEAFKGLDKQQHLDRLKIVKRIVENDAQIRRLTDAGARQVEQLLGQPSVSEQLPEREPARLASFRISNPLDIHAQIRQLLDAGVALTLYGDPDTSRHMLTHLVSLDLATGRISFERRPGDKIGPLMLHQGKATAVAFVDQIKVQFALSELALVSDDTVNYLTASVPDDFYRLQRRNAYRVRPLNSAPLHCMVPVMGAPDGYEEMEVLDISVTGMSIVVPAYLSSIAEQNLLQACFLHLPGHTAFRCDLAIRHVHMPADGHGACRLGVDFVKLNGADERTVQQYVHAVDIGRRRVKPACS